MAVIPNDQISADESWPECWITSGAIHNGDPTNVNRFANVSLKRAESPKSANLISPWPETKIFALLISLWIFPFECI